MNDERERARRPPIFPFSRLHWPTHSFSHSLPFVCLFVCLFVEIETTNQRALCVQDCGAGVKQQQERILGWNLQHHGKIVQIIVVQNEEWRLV